MAATLYTGCTAVYIDGVVFLNDFFSYVEKYAITFFYLQSFSLNLILNAMPDAFGNYKGQIRGISIGGGSMPEKQKKRLKELLPNSRFYILYASTETTTLTTYEFSHYNGKDNCVGEPLPCAKITFVDYEGNLMAETSKDDPGIVVCETPCVMMGYWNDPELTRVTKVDGKVTMTDMGYIGDDGFLYLIGRRDDVIVSGGHKIAPYEVESAVLQIHGIAECACVPSANEAMGAVPKLFVVMNKDAEFSVKRIHDSLADMLESYKIPRIIRVIDELPRVEGSKKIDRKALVRYES
jgi:long-chain acyl-CoA synthetase